MADNKQKISMTMLIFLLLVAAANFAFVNIAFKNNGQTDDGFIAPISGGSNATFTGPAVVGPNVEPELRGEVVVEKKEGGKYDITIFAQNKKKQPVILEGFSADVHLLGMTEPRMIPAFRKVGDGKYTATMTFPEKGRWEVRVRLNKKNESLEFYQSFDIF